MKVAKEMHEIKCPLELKILTPNFKRAVAESLSDQEEECNAYAITLFFCSSIAPEEINESVRIAWAVAAISFEDNLHYISNQEEMDGPWELHRLFEYPAEGKPRFHFFVALPLDADVPGYAQVLKRAWAATERGGEVSELKQLSTESIFSPDGALRFAPSPAITERARHKPNIYALITGARRQRRTSTLRCLHQTNPSIFKISANSRRQF